MAKLVLGFGLASFLTIGPMATSEITPVVLRGLSTAGINLGIALGQLVSNGVIKGFGDRTDHWAYRAPFAIQFAFIAFLLVFYPFTPETPWFLVRKGRIPEATTAFEKLWGGNINAAAKVAALQALIAEEKTAENPRCSTVFAVPILYGLEFRYSVSHANTSRVSSSFSGIRPTSSNLPVSISLALSILVSASPPVVSLAT